jgi:molybdopterin-containing oxidoreductase family membrane subunit
MLAVTAIIMCLLFIWADMGQPIRAWHVLPYIGKMNFPSSILAWDIIVLNGYLALNAILVLYALYKLSVGREYKLVLIMPVIILSIPWALSIHTVTAFIYNGLTARPFWNASILAPRFIASAFCAGPAIMIILFQLIRRFSKVEIDNPAIHKISELMAYALFINLFFLGSEIFKEFYSDSIHKASLDYLLFGLHEQKGLLTPLMRLAFLFNTIAFFILLVPKLRKNVLTLNLSCLLIVTGIYLEKGIGLIVPGFVPDTLGEIYPYWPTKQESIITLGIWAIGGLIYTIMVKFAIPIYTGELRVADKLSAPTEITS